MLSMLQNLLLCGTLITVVFLVLLSLPQCKLREMLMPVVAWAFAIFCGIYCISPVDLVPEAIAGPFGLIDDIFAAIAGIYAARSAMNAKTE